MLRQKDATLETGFRQKHKVINKSNLINDLIEPVLQKQMNVRYFSCRTLAYAIILLILVWFV